MGAAPKADAAQGEEHRARAYTTRPASPRREGVAPLGRGRAATQGD